MLQVNSGRILDLFHATINESNLCKEADSILKSRFSL